MPSLMRQLLVGAIVIVGQVVTGQVVPATNFIDGCVTDYDETATIDYFPEKVTLKYAETFSVEYFNNYKVLTVGTGANATYVLYQCGTPVPVVTSTKYPVLHYISVPVQKVSTGSSSHVPFLELLGERESIIAFHNDPTIVGSPCVDEMVTTGYTTVATLADTADGCGTAADNTVLESLDVEVSFGDSSPAITSYCNPEPLHNGVGVINYSEVYPNPSLKEAEVVKMFGTFFNKETLATEKFEEIESLWACTANNAQGCSLDRGDTPVVAWCPYVPTNPDFPDYAKGWMAPMEDVYYADIIEKTGNIMQICGGVEGGEFMNDQEFQNCFSGAAVCIFVSNFEEIKAHMNETAWGSLPCVTQQRAYDIYLDENSWFEAKQVEPHVLLNDIIVATKIEWWVQFYGIGSIDRLLLRNVATEEVGSGSYFINEGTCEDMEAPLEIQGECELIVDFTTCDGSNGTTSGVIPTAHNSMGTTAVGTALATAAAALLI